MENEKEKNATSLEYVKAAHIVATCPKSRLPMVLEILRQGGIEIQPESEDEAYEFTEEARKNWLKWSGWSATQLHATKMDRESQNFMCWWKSPKILTCK